MKFLLAHIYKPVILEPFTWFKIKEKGSGFYNFFAVARVFCA